MLNSTVTIRFPGVTVRCTSSATRLRTVTVTVIQDPATTSDPDRGDTVTLLFGLWITNSTGPPTAVRMNFPLAALPLTADSTSLFGVARRVPGVGGGDDEGDGEGDGDGDGDGGAEDRAGADDRSVAGDVLWPAVGPSAGDVAVLGAPDAGAGLRLGEDCPPARLDGALDVPKLPSPSAAVEAWAWCVPPTTSSAAIPAAMTAMPTAATPAAACGCRRTSRHHRGPGGTIGFGNPVRPNAPARFVTLTRWARPVGGCPRRPSTAGAGRRAD